MNVAAETSSSIYQIEAGNLAFAACATIHNPSPHPRGTEPATDGSRRHREPLLPLASRLTERVSLDPPFQPEILHTPAIQWTTQHPLRKPVCLISPKEPAGAFHVTHRRRPAATTGVFHPCLALSNINLPSADDSPHSDRVRPRELPRTAAGVRSRGPATPSPSRPNRTESRSATEISNRSTVAPRTSPRMYTHARHGPDLESASIKAKKKTEARLLLHLRVLVFYASYFCCDGAAHRNEDTRGWLRTVPALELSSDSIASAQTPVPCQRTGASDEKQKPKGGPPRPGAWPPPWFASTAVRGSAKVPRNYSPRPGMADTRVFALYQFAPVH